MRRAATDAVEGIITQRKPSYLPQKGTISVQVNSSGCEAELEGAIGKRLMPKLSGQASRAVKIDMVHELQVHIETVT